MALFYLVFVCSDGVPSPEKSATMQRECPRWVEEMDGRGVRLLGRELELPSTAATVSVRDRETLVNDGPFAETQEHIAGIDVLRCEDLEEAIEVAAKHPVSWYHVLEIRPFADGFKLDGAAARFAGGDDSAGEPYCLLECVDGIPGEPQVEESITNEGNAWVQDLKQRGLWVLGHPLQPRETAKSVRVRDGETRVSDGPFADTKEFVGGVSVINVSGREQAIEIAAAHPISRYHMIEVRPFVTE